MNVGMQLSAWGVRSGIRQQEVLANNLANLRTAGFKPDALDFAGRPETAPSAAVRTPHRLDAVAAGHQISATRIEMIPGELTRTEQPLDLALEGAGFFVVSPSPGTAGAERLTRDGRLTLDEEGTLVRATDGAALLDRSGQSIRIDVSRPVEFDGDGRIRQDGTIVGRLHIVDAPTEQLTKDGAQRFRLHNGTPARLPMGTATVRVGHIEASAVDPIQTLNQLMVAARAVQANLNLMQYHDQVLDQTFNTFGRVV